MKRKIGIISLYNGNYNYGGILQAYALTEILNKTGYKAKQIKYTKTCNGKRSIISFIKQNSIKKVFFRMRQSVRIRYIALRDKKVKKQYRDKIKNREDKFNKFIAAIPHTDLVTDKNICILNKEFDFFIVGSDQVWNPQWWNSDYFLDFSEKSRISYAASMGVDDISKKELMYLSDMVNKFHMISVREEKMQHLIQSVTSKQVYKVIDPVFLLTENEWKQVEKNVDIGVPYIFVYLLGKEKKIHRLINEISIKYKQKIVYLPFSQPSELYKEKDFGHVKIYDAEPGEFIHLIRKANYVITDSFHACAFSILFHKQFFVVDRYCCGKKISSDRVDTLLKNMNIENRWIKNVNDFNGYKKINWINVDEIVRRCREEGIGFLMHALSDKND